MAFLKRVKSTFISLFTSGESLITTSDWVSTSDGLANYILTWCSSLRAANLFCLFEIFVLNERWLSWLEWLHCGKITELFLRQCTAKLDHGLRILWRARALQSTTILFNISIITWNMFIFRKIYNHTIYVTNVLWHQFLPSQRYFPFYFSRW